jgi:hypothetical protein
VLIGDCAECCATAESASPQPVMNAAAAKVQSNERFLIGMVSSKLKEIPFLTCK